MAILILFDIDGTLIGIDGAGSRSLNRALNELTGIHNGFQGIDFAGKTDIQIIREGLGKLGLLTDRHVVQNLLGLYLACLHEELPKGEAHVKVGVRKLLNSLSGLGNTHLGLLTGNVETGARVKLRLFGLDQFFPIGAFGSDSEDRNMLLPVAVRRLQEAKSIAVSPQQCLVIGDTPRDVECARIHGAASIAVATGPYLLEHLRETEADLVVPDLADTQKIVDWIYRNQLRIPQ